MKTITIKTVVNAPLQTVWKHWTNPDSIVKWNHASPDWHCPKAFNDLVVGGKFSYTMAARDKSTRFDFGGVYTKVIPNECIEFIMADDRKVSIVFEKVSDITTKIIESFDMESENTEKLQRDGWSAILNNFKLLVESQPA